MLGVGGEGPLGPERPERPDRAVDAGAHAARSSTPDRLDLDREAWATLATVAGLGPVSLTMLVGRFGSASAVIGAARTRSGRAEIGTVVSGVRGAGAAARALGIGEAIAAAHAARARLRRELEEAGVGVLTIDDEAYPARLRAIDLPPPVLFVRGDLEALNRRSAVAVVGTRRPTEAGRLVAARIAGAIARLDGVVVSGLAVGIDGAAHAACVAEERPTVAVLGSGHGRLYPSAHARLVTEIVRTGGLVLAELPPSTAPAASTFPRRNRIISGLTDATVVVEAGIRSGALTTAAWALEQGRECFLVPGALGAPASAGCLRFLRDQSGAARIVAGVPELLEDLGLVADRSRASASVSAASNRTGASSAAALADLGATERAVASVLVGGSSTLDRLVAATGLAPGTVLGALTLLELRGLVDDTLGLYRPAGSLASHRDSAARRRPRSEAA